MVNANKVLLHEGAGKTLHVTGFADSLECSISAFIKSCNYLLMISICSASNLLMEYINFLQYNLSKFFVSNSALLHSP